ncbi:hypothetical protein [Pseudohaliea sp.]|uniref:hypothetical protein n=1 Tax=Pseudohaliea sp. TaxID=2740289 RepID=UPI0032EB862F
MKSIIVHYHIFKNSGSTFDEVLRRNYRDGHVEFDGPFDFFKINQDELLKILRNLTATSCSSHQINLPVPTSIDIRALPVVFLRHPMLRIRSIFRYGKRIGGDCAERGGDFARWIRIGPQSPGRMRILSNAQTQALAGVYGREAVFRRTESGGFRLDFEQAIRNLSSVELLARTEHFDRDVAAFANPLQQHGIEFNHVPIEPENVTTHDFDRPLADRLEQIRVQIGDEL